MKILSIPLTIILIALQYELWFSQNGVREYFALRHAVAIQQKFNDQLALRNQVLATEINDLKTGREAIEEHARNDLGMIKNGETFYQVVQPKSDDKSHT
jgi:cell division protein FtsB